MALDPFNEKAFAALEQLSDRFSRPRRYEDSAADTAVALAEKLLSRETGSARVRINALNLLARVRAKSDPEAAFTYWSQLAELHPQSAEPPLQMARIRERQSRNDEALAAYRKVLALDAANGNALLNQGRLLRRLGRVEEAIEAWRQVCLRTPKNGDAWHELVFMLATAERDSEALAALDAAEAALPATPASWTRLGQAAQAGQFYERAIGYLERAAVAEPQEAGHHARLGQHYFRQGVIDKAYHHLFVSRELWQRDLAVAKQLVATIHTLNTLDIDHMTLSARNPLSDEVLVPERLFWLVREIADKEIIPYAPVPRRVIAVTASLAGGGAERQLVNLLRGLSEPTFGLDLALFCISLAQRGRRDFFLPLLRGTPVEVVTPPESAPKLMETPQYARLIRSFPEDMAGPIAFWLGEFRRRRPQIVHAWQDSTNLTAAVAALLAGVPRIVLCTRSVRPDNPRRRLKRFMREAYKAVLGHPSVVLCNNSRAGADDYAEWLGIDPANIKIVRNGIDFERLAHGADRKRAARFRGELGIPPDAPIVGGVFRMSEEKRPLLWVEAAAEIARKQPRAHFVICGDGPMRGEMSNLAARLGIAGRLHLPGPQDEIGTWYLGMDVMMLASRHEGLPNVLLEAQSLGLPVVAPDVGGVGETLWPGVTGWAVRDADAGTLAERTLFCLADTAWAKRARGEAPTFVRRYFGTEPMLRRTLEVYGLSASCDTA
jgi:glycosyltransferase involved in cell wall biosynthesis/Flp pilus assembly protein TadD